MYARAGLINCFVIGSTRAMDRPDKDGVEENGEKACVDPGLSISVDEGRCDNCYFVW